MTAAKTTSNEAGFSSDSNHPLLEKEWTLFGQSATTKNKAIANVTAKLYFY